MDSIFCACSSSALRRWRSSSALASEVTSSTNTTALRCPPSSIGMPVNCPTMRRPPAAVVGGGAEPEGHPLERALDLRAHAELAAAGEAAEEGADELLARVARDRDHRRVGELDAELLVDDEDAEGRAPEDPLEPLGRAAQLVHRLLALRDVVHDVGDAAAGARQRRDLQVAAEVRLVEVDRRRRAGAEGLAARAAADRGRPGRGRARGTWRPSSAASSRPSSRRAAAFARSTTKFASWIVIPSRMLSKVSSHSSRASRDGPLHDLHGGDVAQRQDGAARLRPPLRDRLGGREEPAPRGVVPDLGRRARAGALHALQRRQAAVEAGAAQQRGGRRADEVAGRPAGEERGREVDLHDAARRCRPSASGRPSSRTRRATGWRR